MDLPSPKMNKSLLVNTSSRLPSPNGLILLIHYSKWWYSTSPHPKKFRCTERLTCTKDLRTTRFPSPWEIATPRDHSSCTSLRWYQQLIAADSSPSEGSSQEPSPLVKGLELWETTINSEIRKTSLKRVSKKLSWWWAELWSTCRCSLWKHCRISRSWLIFIENRYYLWPSWCSLLEKHEMQHVLSRQSHCLSEEPRRPS